MSDYSNFKDPAPTPSKPYVCGDIHWFSDCSYLVPEKRPQGWKADSEKQKKITEALKDTKIKAAVDRSLQKYKDINSPPDDNTFKVLGYWIMAPIAMLIAGTQALPIECYGTIQVTVQTPTGFQQLFLANVAYVSNFMTNLVS
ncbi:hypothetical protein MMC22_002173 [Lobaria immixta]|nr:hypothetical protein [Lobaria immixta]